MRWMGMCCATKLKIALLVSVMLASGCTTTGATSSCAGWKPIILTSKAIEGLSDQDAEVVLAHNLYGRGRGCW